MANGLIDGTSREKILIGGGQLKQRLSEMSKAKMAFLRRKLISVDGAFASERFGRVCSVAVDCGARECDCRVGVRRCVFML